MNSDYPRGISLPSKELMLTEEKALAVVQALSSRLSFNILRLISKEQMDISTIARHLQTSEAHVSESVSTLQKSGLIEASYAPRKRGIRKLCKPAVQKVIIIIKS